MTAPGRQDRKSVTLDATVLDLTEADVQAVRDAMEPPAMIGRREDGALAISTVVNASDAWQAMNQTIDALLAVLRSRGREAWAINVSGGPAD